MAPLVSILIPAYNAEKFLTATLRSVLAQTWPRTEIIVVNDGSQDATLAVAQSFSGPGLKIIDQENQGQSASENRAFRESQGDYIVHLDADDLISPNKVKAQLRRLYDAEPGCVAFGPWGRFHQGPANTRFVPEPFWRDLTPLDLHVEMWERASMIQGGCYLLPRRLVQQAGPWDESLSLINDFDFFPRVLLQARRMLFCPEAVLYYRSGLPEALSGSKSAAAWGSAFRAIVSGTQHLLSHDNGPRVRRACCRAFEELVYGAYPAVPELRRRAWQRVRELDGPYYRPQGGRAFQVVSAVFGWKVGARLRRLAQRIRRPAV